MNTHPEYTIIPAQPGWFVLVLCREEEGVDSLFESPVIAWRVETIRSSKEWESVAIPITEESSESRYAILRPNGDICFPEERMACNLAEALEYFRETVRK